MATIKDLINILKETDTGGNIVLNFIAITSEKQFIIVQCSSKEELEIIKNLTTLAHNENKSSSDLQVDEALTEVLEKAAILPFKQFKDIYLKKPVIDLKTDSN